jgi:hypothetical protein
MVSSELDDVQRGLRSVYRYLIYVLILVVTGFAIVIFRAIQHDANRAFLNLYCGIAYLVFLAWAIGQLRALRPRPPEPPLFDAEFGKDKDTGAWEFSFRLGDPGRVAASGAEPLTFHFGTQLSSLPKEDRPDEAALTIAHVQLAEGKDLDTVCAGLNPRYRGWSAPEQAVYKAYVNGALALRHPAKGEPSSPPGAIGTMDREAAPVSGRAAALVFAITLTGAVLALLLAVWTIGWPPGR